MEKSGAHRAFCSYVAAPAVLLAVLFSVGCGRRDAPVPAPTPRPQVVAAPASRPTKLDVARIKQIARDALFEAESLEKPFRTPVFATRSDSSELPGNCMRWPTRAERAALYARVEAWARTAHKGERLIDGEHPRSRSGHEPNAEDLDYSPLDSAWNPRLNPVLRFGCSLAQGTLVQVHYTTEKKPAEHNEWDETGRAALLLIGANRTPKLLASTRNPVGRMEWTIHESMSLATMVILPQGDGLAVVEQTEFEDGNTASTGSVHIVDSSGAHRSFAIDHRLSFLPEGSVQPREARDEPWGPIVFRSGQNLGVAVEGYAEVLRVPGPSLPAPSGPSSAPLRLAATKRAIARALNAELEPDEQNGLRLQALLHMLSVPRPQTYVPAESAPTSTSLFARRVYEQALDEMREVAAPVAAYVAPRHGVTQVPQTSPVLPSAYRGGASALWGTLSVEAHAHARMARMPVTQWMVPGLAGISVATVRASALALDAADHGCTTWGTFHGLVAEQQGRSQLLVGNATSAAECCRACGDSDGDGALLFSGELQLANVGDDLFAFAASTSNAADNSRHAGRRVHTQAKTLTLRNGTATRADVTNALGLVWFDGSVALQTPNNLLVWDSAKLAWVSASSPRAQRWRALNARVLRAEACGQDDICILQSFEFDTDLLREIGEAEARQAPATTEQAAERDAPWIPAQAPLTKWIHDLGLTP